MDPPSVSSISRLLRGGGIERKDDRKDYSIHGILGGKQSNFTLSTSIESIRCYRITFECLMMSHQTTQRTEVNKI